MWIEYFTTMCQYLGFLVLGLSSIYGLMWLLIEICGLIFKKIKIYDYLFTLIRNKKEVIKLINLKK